MHHRIQKKAVTAYIDKEKYCEFMKIVYRAAGSIYPAITGESQLPSDHPVGLWPKLAASCNKVSLDTMRL